LIALPQRSDLIDRSSASHFAEVLEENRNRLHPVAVAIDHRVLQPGVDLFGSTAHGHGSFR
jgi:hypothetical protein